MISKDDRRPSAAGEPVATDAWRRLYAAAVKVGEMEPWAWMEETDIFGVWPAGRDSPVFVSVMGLLGEYYAVAVYPGPGELHQFWRLQAMPEGEQSMDRLLEIAQLHAVFGGARDLEAPDKRIIKELGLKFRGNHAWPYFRSFRPGYFPWFIEPLEASLLAVALEQLVDVAPRVQKDRSLLISKDQPGSVLVREPTGEGEKAGSPWRDRHYVFPPVATTSRIEVPASLMSAVRALKTSRLTFEVDVFAMPMRIGKQGERPQRPYALLVVNPESRFIMGIELLTVETTLEGMWASVPQRLLEIIRQSGMRPAGLAVHTPWVHMVLDSLCAELGIALRPQRRLPALQAVRRDLEQHGLGGK